MISSTLSAYLKMKPPPLMNNTKWKEVQAAMHGLNDLSPRWRTKDVESGYDTIHWVEIEVTTEKQRRVVERELVKIHVPAERTDAGFKIYGYVEDQRGVDYLRTDGSLTGGHPDR